MKLLKLKFKHSLFHIGKKMVINAGDEHEIEDKDQAKSLIEADMAEAVVEEKKKKDPKKVVKKVETEEVGE